MAWRAAARCPLKTIQVEADVAHGQIAIALESACRLFAGKRSGHDGGVYVFQVRKRLFSEFYLRGPSFDSIRQASRVRASSSSKAIATER